ncbi:hypothetical protein [Glaciihabitans sp. UYNi722]|uniref:hypothetical protein n=1 Tax=Glaciihabitans sp. UYNi722 TaxID=3156344 RepID=UPI00339272BF
MNTPVIIRTAIGTLICSALIAMSGVAASPGFADETQSGYAFLPGDPVIFSNGGTASGGVEGACTGGYVIRGDSGVFILGPKACSVIFSSVRGSDRNFGYVVSKSEPDGNALIRENPGDDAFQVVRDPLTGAQPGTGAIVGWMPSDQQSAGMLIGKMGIGTGWTEGRIVGAVDFRGQTLLCAEMKTGLGDAGGPVWRNDANGLRALGTIQAFDPVTTMGCYRPIQETLWNYGASLPSFGPDQGRPPFGQLAPGTPYLDLPGLAVPVKNIPVRGDWH